MLACGRSSRLLTKARILSALANAGNLSLAQARAPLLRVEGLRKSYATPQGPLPVLRGVDLALDAGTSLALTGESGSGKSTLLHLIGALDDADSGEIALDGVALTRLSESARAAIRREKIGVVFQQFNLIASLTVAENLAFQARLAGRYDPVWQEELTDRLGLAALVARYPEQLSGGQQQRVAMRNALRRASQTAARRRADRQSRRSRRRRRAGACARSRRRDGLRLSHGDA